MKKSKKKVKLPAKGSYRPRNARETQFIRVLEDWHGVSFLDPFDKAGTTIHRVVSPEKKVYRYAHPWEAPDVVIDANILPTEHAIRLVRERSKAMRIMVKRQLKVQHSRARSR